MDSEQELPFVVVETKNRDAWEVAEEIRVILGLRSKVVERGEG